MDNLTTIFIAVTAVAVILQAGLLLGMYLAMRKTSTRLESLAEEVKTKALPAIDSAQALIADIRPKLQIIADNLAETTSTMREQVQRVDATVNDVVDRARLQVIRADDLLTRTLDRVEETSEIVHKTVVSPVRQFSGLIQGLTAGIEFLVGGRGHRNGRSRDPRRPVPQDEMFI
jgi:tetrahydromethanopterin S-methyltransferase subunit F